MIVAVTGANLVNRVGRRPLFIVATSCMMAGMVAWTITGSVFARTRSEATGAGILTCIIFFASSYNICWNPLAVAYPVEILPFNIRAKGIALLMGSIKGASFFNQFVNPIGLQNLGWKYYIVYCVWLGIVLLVVFFVFPETKVSPAQSVLLTSSLSNLMNRTVLLRRFPRSLISTIIRLLQRPISLLRNISRIERTRTC
jgi:MFS family permease